MAAFYRVPRIEVAARLRQDGHQTFAALSSLQSGRAALGCSCTRDARSCEIEAHRARGFEFRSVQ